MKSTNSNKLLKIFLYITLFTILAPMAILILWIFVGRWPWPNLLPATYSLRAIKEIFAPYSNVFSILFSSILLSLSVAILSAIIATITARALVLYDFIGKTVIEFLTIAPILVPGAVFAMGIHIVFIKLSLADTVLGVIIIHLIYTLPYTINIMKDLTESVGKQMEVQAYVLGASPLKSFIYITFPLLTPGIMASISMAYITSFSQYFITLLIGGGTVKSFNVLMVPFIAKGDRSLSSAYALVFIISTLLVFLIIDKIIKKLPYQDNKEEI
ncbi:ABC transporter permease subunit [Tissierella pigra]|uniref:ABC transporter permease subunit n=1 Tax=Tissierella pigra TaxID=2607614 RepID=A0A6N7XHU4_9FIRM|nr:ABC transporter permease subunit [Tissierella pigra]MBU5428297.1 ABC transporter permease subunit [Tissierella pigra]MSU01621.1 ABC transporter permease subunit [Tissierella pigra]